MITRHQLGQAGLKANVAASGAVTLIQRFGSAANLNIHLHCLVLDGVYRPGADGTPVMRLERQRAGGWPEAEIKAHAGLQVFAGPTKQLTLFNFWPASRELQHFVLTVCQHTEPTSVKGNPAPRDALRKKRVGKSPVLAPTTAVRSRRVFHWII